jgi:NADH dehydrogenase (ubiquinone) Fe-S protein 6
MAICDGGGGALGHPLEYIELDLVKPGPNTCKYCGLRFISTHHAHHGHDDAHHH